MRRRDFIKAIAGTVAVWPISARAQQPHRRVVLLVGFKEIDARAKVLKGVFQTELDRLGWIDGRNVRVDYHWAGDADREQIRELAKEIVQLQPDVIVAQNTIHVENLLRETQAIPIVFVAVADPVGSGFVASLSRPGGNVTGFVTTEWSLAGKWLELLKKIAPKIVRAGILFEPHSAPAAGEYYLPTFNQAAASMSLTSQIFRVSDAFDIASALSDLQKEPAGGLVIMPSTVTHSEANRRLIVALTAKYGIPAIYPFRFWVSEGGLISYGVDANELWRGSAGYVDRVLRGTKPQDLPVQLPVKFELCINVKAAKALGLEVPVELITISDAVID